MSTHLLTGQRPFGGVLQSLFGGIECKDKIIVLVLAQPERLEIDGDFTFAEAEITGDTDSNRCLPIIARHDLVDYANQNAVLITDWCTDQFVASKSFS